jgi:TonB family protein
MYKKLLITLTLALLSLGAWAQEDESEETTKRPSWSEGLPERQSAADLNTPDFKPEIDNDIEIDMSEFDIKPKADITLDLPISAELPAENEQSETAEAEVEEQPAATLVTEEAVPEAEFTAPAEEPSQPEEAVVEPVEDAIVEVDPVISEPAETLPEEAEPAPVSEQIAEAEDGAMTETPAEDTLGVEETLAAVKAPVMTETDPIEAATEQEQEYVWSIIKQEPVKYPVKAAMENKEGWVDIEVTINADGQVVSATAVKYSRGGRLFGRPAVQSVNQWLFDPPKNYGISGNVSRIYKIEFNL